MKVYSATRLTVAIQQTFLEVSHWARYANLMDRHAFEESFNMQQPNGGESVNQIHVDVDAVKHAADLFDQLFKVLQY